eukprot:5653594-Pleurochrysis_carterae.AAC.1
MYLFVLSTAPTHTSDALADAAHSAVAAATPPIARTRFETRGVHEKQARPPTPSPQSACSPLPWSVPLHPTGFMNRQVQLN